MTLSSGLVAAGWILFVSALPMVSADTDVAGELLRGFDHKGYQCFLGAFLLVVSPAAPLWLAISLGNVTAVVAPLLVWWPAAARVRRIARVLLGLAAVAATALGPLGPLVGIFRLHVGYFVWCAAVWLLAVGMFLALAQARPDRSPL